MNGWLIVLKRAWVQQPWAAMLEENCPNALSPAYQSKDGMITDIMDRIMIPDTLVGHAYPQDGALKSEQNRTC